MNQTSKIQQALPLAGLRVVEFTHMVMGPACGVILADLGAEVIKVEPLKGDNTRRLKGSGAGYFPMYNRNKKSITVDVKTPRGLELARSLTDTADIVIENFRPGAMDKLGLGYEALKRSNPGLIYCSLKGFLSGPYQNRTALDEVVQMMGGLAYMTGLPDKPMRAGSSVIDITGGMFGVIGILAAVAQRHRSQQGQYVCSSLFETTAFMVGQHMAQEAVTGSAPPPMSVRQSAWSIYDIFVSGQGDRIFVGVVSDALWRSFCAEFELAAFREDRGLDTNNQRVAQRDRILRVVRSVFASYPTDELMAKLEAAGMPFAPINTPSDLFSDPHLTASEGLLALRLSDGDNAGQPANLPAIPLELNGQRCGLERNLPAAGEHNQQVLRDLGYSQSELSELASQGIINVNQTAGN